MAAVLWFIFCALTVLLVIIVLIRLIKFLGVATKEKKLTRMEMGRLADELEQARKKTQEGKKHEPPGNSG